MVTRLSPTRGRGGRSVRCRCLPASLSHFLLAVHADYPPFEGAVAAGVGSVMCSYNLVQANASHLVSRGETVPACHYWATSW